jgi:UDP-N-acetylmuramate dehydrogenase
MTRPEDLIQTDVSGVRCCTYRVGGDIAYFAQPTTTADAVAVLQYADTQDWSLTVLGSGSNTLLASAGVSGLLLNTRALTQLSENPDDTITMGAGWPMARAAKWAQAQSLTGAEFWIGIPGTLGGSVAMNAGAMGQDTAGIVTSATVYNRDTQTLEVWSTDRLAFSYRKSAIIPERHVVLDVTMRLPKGDASDIDALMAKSLTFRQTHHPKEPNGGSVFKNPLPDKPAGLLLDQLGAKSWREGGACVSPLHANFIVNVGGATSTDILRLMARMKRAVWEAHGLVISPENRFLGDASPEEQMLWKELKADAACYQVA